MEIVNAICKLLCHIVKRDLKRKYPVICLYYWCKHGTNKKCYNDIPKLVELAKKGAAIVSIEVRESDIGNFFQRR